MTAEKNPTNPTNPPRPTSPTDRAAVREAVPAALAGERLDRVVSMITGCSRSVASSLIDAGEVTVNGVPLTARTHRVVEDDEIAVVVPEPEDHRLEPDGRVAFTVVHEDDDVIVVDKPAGLVVHPGAGNPEGTLVHGLLARFPDIGSAAWPDPARPGIVHRIDRETSGLLMIARNLDAYDSLVEQLSNRDVERHYTALVWGSFAAPAGEIDGPIARSQRDPTKMTVAAGGKEARTGYVVEREYHDPVVVSLLSCRLFTGRTHQIRVHMQSIGHSVVGDPRYSGYRQSLPIDRFFLHAASLGFAHPRSGERLRFESALPDDLTAVLDRLS